MDCMRVLLLTIGLLLLLMSSNVFGQVQEAVTEPPAEEEQKIDILPEEAVLLGEAEENGIIAMAWLYRPSAASLEADQGARLPHLLFLRFISVESNIAVEKGLVAHKIEDIEGNAAPAVKLEFKNGYFVDDLSGVAPGKYILNIGCKLEDEKKRQFQYEMVLR